MRTLQNAAFMHVTEFRGIAFLPAFLGNHCLQKWRFVILGRPDPQPVGYTHQKGYPVLTDTRRSILKSACRVGLGLR